MMQELLEVPMIGDDPSIEVAEALGKLSTKGRVFKVGIDKLFVELGGEDDMGKALHSGISLQTAYNLGMIEILYHRKDITLTKLEEEIGGNWHRLRLCLRLAVAGEPMPWEEPQKKIRSMAKLVNGSFAQQAIFNAALAGNDWKKEAREILEIKRQWENLSADFLKNRKESDRISREAYNDVFGSWWQRVKNFFNIRIF